MPQTPSPTKLIVADFKAGALSNTFFRTADSQCVVLRGIQALAERELTKAGATVVKADYDDLPSMCKAFKGCHAVFSVTDYFEAFDRELQQGINIVDAAKAAGIKHMVFSTCEDLPYDVPIFKHKAAATKYLKKSGVPYTSFYIAWYYSNFFLFDVLRRNPLNGGWTMEFPYPTDTPIPSTSPKDIGAYVLGAFVNPAEWIGKDMRVCNEYVTPRQYGEMYAEVTGRPVEITEVSRADFFAMEHKPFALSAWTIFRWFLEIHEGNAPRLSPELAGRLCPSKDSWRDYMVEHQTGPPEQPVVIECVMTNERFSR